MNRYRTHRSREFGGRQPILLRPDSAVYYAINCYENCYCPICNSNYAN